MSALKNYGERKCLTCGKTFVAKKYYEIVCSQECKIKRHRALSNAWQKEHPGPTKTAYKTLQKEIEVLKKGNKSLQDESDKYYVQLLEAKKTIAKLQNNLNKANQEIETYKTNLAKVNEKLEKAQKDLASKIATILPKNLDDLNGIKILECKRMHLKAMNLPCGTRKECFTPTRCEKCPEDAVEPKEEVSLTTINEDVKAAAAAAASVAV
ncbi:MAG: hypothetical protein IJU37_11850 [Desulfovibrio sp.]|nr:hypothetical protein [Desulfovibrio sp.]